MFRTINELMERAGKGEPVKIVVSYAHEKDLLKTLLIAARTKLAEFILLGDENKIKEYLGNKHPAFKIINIPDEKEANRKALELVCNGKVQILMNGISHPSKFLKAILEAKEICPGIGFLSHMGLFEVPGYDRMIFVTDAGVNLAPDLAAKVEIVHNAIAVANRLGLEKPAVAMITAVETINYKSMPSTVDAAIIAKMNSTGQIKNAIIDGPLALDNAISERAAQIKGIKSPVAGKADILVQHNIETANVLYKILTYFAKARVASCVAGAHFPVILTSRTDSSDTRINSIALAKILCQK